MPGIRNVIFDLDGTLLDSLPGIARSADVALAAVNLPPIGYRVRAYIGPPLGDMLAAVSGLADAAAIDTMVRAFRADYSEQSWRMTTCYPGGAAALHALRRSGCTLWVLSNKPHAPSSRILENLGILDCFEELACRDSRTPTSGASSISKSKRLAELIARRGLTAADTILVGDTQEDCAAALDASVSCLIVPHGYGTGLENLPLGCRKIAGWDELLTICTSAIAP
jgi:phosphoglycolate phosphatase